MARIYKNRCPHGQLKQSCARCHSAWVKSDKRQNPAKWLWLSARDRAKRRGLEFTLLEADIIVPATCPVLGIPLDSSSRDRTPSLDRKDLRFGYVPGNVAVISLRANRIKSDATPEELKLVSDYAKLM